MGNIVEEIIKRNALKRGLIPSETLEYNKTKKFVESKGVYNILYRTILHLLPPDKKVEFQLYMDGGSYTDGDKIVVGVLKHSWGMENNLVFSILKALTGHETEHVVSSDFDLFVLFQKRIGDDFDNYIKTGVLGQSIGKTSFDSRNTKKDDIANELQKAGIHKRYGAKLAAHLLNSVEDGRIEKRLGNRMKGYVKHIKFMNALIWEQQPVTGRDELQEFLFSITSMCVTGLKSKDWDKVYGGTELDDLLNQIRPLIIKGINEPTAQGCAEQTYEIYKVIAPKIAEMLQKNLDAMDEMSSDFNFSNTKPQPSQGGGNSFPGNSVSTHFTPEDPNEEDSDDNSDDKQDSNGDGKPSKGGKKDKKDEENSSGSPGSSSDSDEDSDEKGDDESSTDGDVDGKGTKSQDDQSSDSNSKGQGEGDKEEGSEEGNSSNSDNSSEKNKGSEKSENDLTDNSEQNARDEEDLVKDFLKNAENELGKDLENDMKQIKNEEAKIQREEERRAKESGNLSERELQDVLSGRGVRRFSQEVLGVYEKPLPEHIALPGKKLHRQLEKILKDKQGYNSRNRKRGVLDPTGVWKLGIKEYNTFVKKGKPTNSSYAVSVLVDNSGSMTDYVSGRKRKADFANEACAILEEGLKGLVPFRITRFDDDSFSRGVRHRIVSDFGDIDKVNRTYSAGVQTGAANADSISIRVATKELMKRSESKKILFVLSDGLPSSYYNESDAITSVQKAVRDARKEGVIVIAICFGTQKHLDNTRDSYRKMYQKGIIMTEPQQIPTQLVKVLEREIK